MISCDVSPVAMFFNLFSICCKTIHHNFSKREHIWVLLWGVAVSSDIRTLANTKGPHAESQLASISTFYFNLFFFSTCYFSFIFQLIISNYNFNLTNTKGPHTELKRCSWSRCSLRERYTIDPSGDSLRAQMALLAAAL